MDAFEIIAQIVGVLIKIACGAVALIVILIAVMWLLR